MAADKEGGHTENIRKAENYKNGFQSHAKQGWRFRKKNFATGKFIKIGFEYQEMIAGNDGVKRCLEYTKMKPQIADLRCFVCGKSCLTQWRLSAHLRLFCHKNKAIPRI